MRHDNFPIKPNISETVKTTLPLLTTVLAGFAVTIIAQILIQQNIIQVWPPANPVLFVGLVFIAVSVPLLLTSTFFAVEAQGYDFKSVPENIKNFELYQDYAYKRWALWYSGAVNAFRFGVIVFVGGVGLILWNYLGSLIALIFLLIVAISLIWGGVLFIISRRL